MPSSSSNAGFSSRAAISSWLKASVAMSLRSPLSTSGGAYRSTMAVPARRALVTGGTGRLGRAVAARLEREGYSVVAAGRRDGDLSRASDAWALVEGAASQLGGLDLVVHAASDGFAPRPVEEVTEEDWDR